MDQRSLDDDLDYGTARHLRQLRHLSRENLVINLLNMRMRFADLALERSGSETRCRSCRMQVTDAGDGHAPDCPLFLAPFPEVPAS